MTLNPSHRLDGDTVIQGTLDAYKLLENGASLGSAVLGTDRGVVAASTAYVVGDVVTIPYAASGGGYARVLITANVTSSASRFITGGAYKRLSPRGTSTNVMDWGAVGNGSTDDTAAIQAAIDYASSTAQSTGAGGSVFLPGGYYITSATLVLKKHVWLIGEGQRSTTIKLATNANCDVIKSFDTGGASGNADYVGIINLCVDGNKDNQNGAGPYHGIVFNTTPTSTAAAGDSFFDMHHTVQNVTVYKCKGNGIDCTGRSAIQLYNMHLQANRDYGLDSTFDMTIIGCEAEQSGLSGFFLNNGSIKMVGCKSYLNGVTSPTTDAGFKIGSTGASELVGCEAQQNYGPGFMLTGTDSTILSGCSADENCFTGLSVLDTVRVGVVMTTGSQYCVVDVTCMATPYALHIDATCTNNTINMSQARTHSGDITPTSVIDASNGVVVNAVRASPIRWGPATGDITASPDTNLYRSAANVLKTDDTFHAVLGVATFVKAGTPSDADWAVAPPVGTLVVDTSASKLWARTAAATWKGVVIA